MECRQILVNGRVKQYIDLLLSLECRYLVSSVFARHNTDFGFTSILYVNVIQAEWFPGPDMSPPSSHVNRIREFTPPIYRKCTPYGIQKEK